MEEIQETEIGQPIHEPTLHGGSSCGGLSIFECECAFNLALCRRLSKQEGISFFVKNGDWLGGYECPCSELRRRGHVFMCRRDV